MTEQEIIQGCRKEDPKAQKVLYDKMSPKMLGVCRRYLRNIEDAEDAMVNGFFKVLTKMNMYSGSGSFEGWVRRIMVNECLMFLRKKHNFNMTVELNNIEVKSTVNAEDELMEQDILKVLEKLPTGYRTIFNLYVIEGYKHREIAEILNISINTSKSQLLLAKNKMRKLLSNYQYPDVG